MRRPPARGARILAWGVAIPGDIGPTPCKAASRKDQSGTLHWSDLSGGRVVPGDNFRMPLKGSYFGRLDYREFMGKKRSSPGRRQFIRVRIAQYEYKRTPVEPL